MAHLDSTTGNLDKRTKELSTRKIENGQGLSEAQMAQNQLQAIQNERMNNLAIQRAQVGMDAQNQELLSQAAQIGVSGNTQAILQKYGMKGAPRVTRTQSRDVKVVPPNITITNNYNTTNNSGGPVAGREIAFKNQGAAGSDGNSSSSKFKTWLSGVFLRQREENAKRERFYDKREATLTRSSNKMLRRIESASKEMASSFNPERIGQSVGNQFRILLMLFAVRFLAKHWTKVLNAVAWVGDKLTAAGDYFGITDEGKRIIARGGGFHGALLTFFGAKKNEKDLFTVFKRLGSEFIDHLKTKLDQAMELRGDAIKSIKFPALSGDITSMLGDIAGYLGNILTAMVDPKKGVQNSIKSNLAAAAKASSSTSDQNDGTGLNRLMGQAGLKDTSQGEAVVANIGKNGKKNRILQSDALSDNGEELVDSRYAEISQSQDILGAMEATGEGKIQTARMAMGLQRLQTAAGRNGSVTVDREFIDRMYGSDASALIRSGHIKARPMKFVRVGKDSKDFEDINAFGFGEGFIRNRTARAVGNKINDYTSGLGGNLVSGTAMKVGTLNSIRNEAAGLLRNVPFLGDIAGFNADVQGAAYNQVLKWLADKYKLKLVDADDNSQGPAVKINGKPYFYTAYTIDKTALSQLSQKLTGEDNIDISSENFVNRIRQHLINTGGGEAAIRRRYKGEGSNEDFDVRSGYQALRDITSKEEAQKAERTDFEKSMAEIANNGKAAINSAVQTVGEGVSYAGKIVGNALHGSGKLSKDEATYRKKYMMNLLVNQAGLNPGAAAGVIGNLMNEGLLVKDPGKLGDDCGALGGGIAGFRGAPGNAFAPGTELGKLKAWSDENGLDWRKFETQAQYLVRSGNAGKALRIIREATNGKSDQDSVRLAAIAWGRHYEKFKGHNAYDDNLNYVGPGDSYKGVSGAQNYNTRARFGVGVYKDLVSSGADFSNMTMPTGGGSGGSYSGGGGSYDSGSGVVGAVTNAASGIGDSISSVGDTLQSTQVFNVKSKAEIDRDNKVQDIINQGSKLWQKHSRYFTSPKVIKKWKNFNEFIELWKKMSDSARKKMIADVETWEVGQDMQERSGATKDDVYASGTGAAAVSNFGGHKLSAFSKDDVTELHRLVSLGRVDEADKYYSEVMNRHTRSGKAVHVDESGQYRDFKARILYGEDYDKVAGNIIELEEQLKKVKDPRTKQKLQYQLSELKAKRDAYQRNEISNQKGWSIGSMGKISQTNKKTKDYRVKLAEAQHRKENFHEYFESITAGKNLDGGQLADLYNELWDQVCKDVDQAEKDMQNFEGKTKAEVAEIKKKNEQHARFIKTNKEDITKEIDKLTKNGKTYLDSVKELFEKYGEGVLTMIGLSVRDLQDGYCRTKDLMYEHQSFIGQMQDIDIDERMGNITHEEAQRKRQEAWERFNNKSGIISKGGTKTASQNISFINSVSRYSGVSQARLYDLVNNDLSDADQAEVINSLRKSGYDVRDGKIVATAEHNGYITKTYKNTGKQQMATYAQRAKLSEESVNGGNSNSGSENTEVPESISRKSSAPTNTDKQYGKWSRHAIGGYTGFGGKYEIAGIVHKGEYVIPADMATKLPRLLGSMERMRLSGRYSDSEVSQDDQIIHELRKANELSVAVVQGIASIADETRANRPIPPAPAQPALNYNKPMTS